MFQRMRLFSGRHAHAVDGPIGTVYDVFFDDETWQVRYFVIDTGNWIPSFKMVLPVTSVDSFDGASLVLNVKHPRALIARSRYIDLAHPSNAAEEHALRRHYGAWPHWAPYLFGAGPHKLTNLLGRAGAHLRGRCDISAAALHSGMQRRTFRLALAGGASERLDDLVVDAETWAIEQFTFRRGLAGFGQEYCVDRDQLLAYARATRTLTIGVDSNDVRSVGHLRAGRWMRRGA